MKKLIKIGAAGLAFFPMFALVTAAALRHKDLLSESTADFIIKWCAIFNFPAYSVLALIKSFNVSQIVLFISAFFLMLLWSSLVAWFFWKAAGTFQGEDEPDAEKARAGGKYDWVGFQVRFFIGFIIGFLFGWRFVKNSTSMSTLLTASIITGIIAGLLYGLSRPPDFWTRG
jgi:hypothetical protein